jgi:FlaA1/EpsC-like NDP-sugar epimerase
MISATLRAGIARKVVLLPRWKKIGMMLAADLVALPLCFFVAMVLRIGSFDGALSYGIGVYALVVLITIPVFIKTGLYRAVIRFIDRRLLTTAGTVLAAAIACAYALEYVLNETKLPRTALVIYWFIAFSYVVASRLMTRALLRTHQSERRTVQEIVAIYGASEPGAQLAFSMRRGDEFCPVCFFDDKREFRGHTVGGLPVYHTSRLAEMVSQLGISLIVLAIPAASPPRLREVMLAMRKSGVPVKILNNLMELTEEKTAKEAIREIKIEDLLGRDAVPPQPHLFAKCVQGQNVLVTGAGGSIGSELCRQIATLSPSRLHLLDHSEYALYTIQQELEAHFPDVPLHAHLGSVCDARLVERVMQEGRIHTVYHAAAYKHVPLVEANMAEGILNNVIGAQVIATAAEKNRVQTCVLISTDKAVRPTNIMGASKRVAELIFQAAQNSAADTTFCMVRFGNVLGSSGSVVPLFQTQIEKGGPITITHADVARYFMLIPEAAQLVIQAGAMAKGGDVFVLDMGDPIKIVDLARTMIETSGLAEKTVNNPTGDIEIQFVGLRPGEKLYEELLIGEHASPSDHPRIMCTIESALEPALLDVMVRRLTDACRMNDRERIMHVMKTVVVEYAPQTNDKAIEKANTPVNFTGPSYRYNVPRAERSAL